MKPGLYRKVGVEGGGRGGEGEGGSGKLRRFGVH